MPLVRRRHREVLHDSARVSNPDPVHTERQWSVDSPMPPEAEQVCAINGWQIESLALSVEECAEALFDYDAEPGDYELSYYTWSDGIPFVFDAAARTFKRQETAA